MNEQEEDIGPVSGKDEARVFDSIPHSGSVKKGYKPEGFESQEAFLADMRQNYEADLAFDDENRKEAIDDKKFAAGEQWDPIVLEQRKGLPNLVINSVPQFTAQLVGDWRSNRNGIKVVPQEDGDAEVASIRGDLVRSIEMKSRASRVYDSAFESMVQCGDGAFRVCVDYTRDDVFDQEVLLKTIEDCHSVVWDRMSIDPTGRDARHVFVDDALTRKEFARKWPDHDPSVLSENAKRDYISGGWFDSDTVKVTEYWRMIERDRLLMLFEDGAVIAMDDEEDLAALVQAHGAPVKSRIAPCSYAQMHLVTGHAILDGPYEYKISRVPIIRMSGRVVNVQGRRIRYGLVRFMKDAVRLRNFWRSVAAEQLGYAPKAQWIATESAVEGYEDDIRKGHLTRDPLIKVSDDAIIGQNIQRLDPPAPQMALLNEAQVNSQDMKDVTGIHDASLGIRSNETSGKAISARQREGDIASLTYYDNGNESILEAGDIINQLIPQIYDGTRTIRIIGEDEEAKMARINDPMDPEAVDLGVGNYDVALSTGTSFTTRRVEAAEAMMNAVQVWPEIMQIAGDLVVKAQDWPGADKLSERLKKAIPPNFLGEEEGGNPVPPEIMQQLQELQANLQAVAQENESLKNDKSLDARKLEIDAYGKETDRMKVIWDAQQDRSELGAKALMEAAKSQDVSKTSASGGNSSQPSE